MNPGQAKALGEQLQQARHDAGLSLRGLQKLTGIDDGLLSRMESGAIAKPDPEKLRRIADALDIAVADVFALADYLRPSDLPTATPYLRAKYRDLPAEDLANLTDEVNDVLARYGIDHVDGPVDGEDEVPEATPTTRKKKGGTS